MSSADFEKIEQLLGKALFDHQRAALDFWESARLVEDRLCLYYKTGSGKTLTSLLCMWARVQGQETVLVVAPPSTHMSWAAAAAALGMEVWCVSHAKFRQQAFKVLRTTPIIIDEFHMLGGYQAQGWKKLERISRGLQAPLIICSATPNYNDVERCYCVQKIVDPDSTRGGYLEFLYQHCETRQSPFSMTPEVVGFRSQQSAAEFLAAMRNVLHVPDDVDYTVQDVPLPRQMSLEFDEYGLSPFGTRLMASQIEARHTERRFNLVDANDLFRQSVYDELSRLVGDLPPTKVLMFCNSSRIAEALYQCLCSNNVPAGIITGKDSKKVKEKELHRFIHGDVEVLVGTASIATGTDGIDKVSDLLILVDDTDDESLRRQIIGRILPRGADTDASKKVIYRLSFVSCTWGGGRHSVGPSH